MTDNAVPAMAEGSADPGTAGPLKMARFPDPSVQAALSASVASALIMSLGIPKVGPNASAAGSAGSPPVGGSSFSDVLAQGKPGANEDVDMAIRVMVESFIAAQKYSVQTTLRKKFRKYIVYKKHNNSLIMHILQQMVRDQVGVFFPVVSGGYCSQVFFLGLMFVRCMFSLTCVLHATVFSLLFGRRR